MTSILLEGPAIEPLTLADAKAHLRLDGTGEDMLVQSLITSSRLHVETLTGRALVTQEWRLVLDHWPDARVLKLPIGPLQSVDAVRVYEDEDIVAAIDPSAYLVETAGVPGRLYMRGAQTWPAPGRAHGGIEIDVTAGYGDQADDVPQPLRQAMLHLLAHWYAVREAVCIGPAALQVPVTVDALVAPYRAVRL